MMRFITALAEARSLQTECPARLKMRDSEKTDYEPTMILDYKGIRRYSSAFWLD